MPTGPITASNMSLNVNQVVTPQRQPVCETRSRKDYTLNIDKCLRKKLSAAKRQKIDYTIKGGGLVANLDAVSFELFKYACTEFHSAFNDQIVRVDRDDATDNKGNTVQNTYTVHLQNNIQCSCGL